MRDDEASVGQGRGDHPAQGRAFGEAIESPQDERVEGESSEFGERVASYVDVDQVIGSDGVGRGRQPSSCSTVQCSPCPLVHSHRRRRKKERLSELDSTEDVYADQVEGGGQIIRQRGIVAKEGVAEPIGGVRHPTSRKDSGPQIGCQLVNPQQVEGTVAAAPGIQ